VEHGAVRGPAAAEAVPLHAAGKPAALARPGDVDVVAHLEQRRRELLAQLELGGRLHAELAQHPEEPPVGLGEVALQGLGHVGLPLAVEAELDGVVAVGGLGLLLDHVTGARLDHCDGHRGSVGGEDLGHPQLSAYQSLFHSIHFRAGCA